MLKLTKKAHYGLIALTHLARREPERSASAKEIAEAYGIPLPALSKILQRLARQGFLESVQGTNGGYRLAREAGLINTFEVVRAIEGPVFLTSCYVGEEECGHSSLCTVREPLRKVNDDIVRLLENITIRDLTKDEVRPASVLNERGQLTVFGGR